MEFLSLHNVTKELTLNKCVIPNPIGHEVLIRVAYSGICGTDLHILDGEFPAKSDSPLTLGHEFVGTVESVGSEVRNFKIGTKVAVNPNIGCNNCDLCHRGTYHYCENGGLRTTIGIFRNGGWATHAIVPDNQVHLVSDGIDLQHAVLAEPLSCIVHGWNKIETIHVGEKILVLGAGIIGLLWIAMLHMHGLRKTVTVSEPQEKRRLGVERLDLDYDVKTPTEVKDNFDLVVDCSGSAPAMESAMSLLRRGGRLCIFGVANPKATLTVRPFDFFIKELKVLGVNINPFMFPRALKLIDAMGERYLDYNKLGIRVFKLTEYKDALQALRNGEISKAVFKCT